MFSSYSLAKVREPKTGVVSKHAGKGLKRVSASPKRAMLYLETRDTYNASMWQEDQVAAA